MRETTRAGLLAASLGETKALWMMAAKGGVDLEVKDFEDKGLEEVCPDFKRAKVVKILQRARESRERQCGLDIGNIVEHAKLQLFFSSEVKPKWLVRTKLTHPPCSPSAWTSARRWQDRGTPSTSPSPLVPPSPSPWTPGARK